MTVITDTRVVRLQRTAARTGHQHSDDQLIVESVSKELVTAADVVALPPGSLITLQRGPGAGLTEEGSVLNAAYDEIGGVQGGQTTSVSFNSEDGDVTSGNVFQSEVDFAQTLSNPGEYAINYKTFQIKTYTTVPTTPGQRTQITYSWAPIREYLQWGPEDLIPDLEAFGDGPHQAGGGGTDGYGIDYLLDGCNVNIDNVGDGYKEISLDIQSIAGEGLLPEFIEGACPRLKVDLDAYQVRYDDSGNTYIFADNVQDAITEIDGYIHVGEPVHIRKYGSGADNYPFNSVFSTNGNVYPLGTNRILIWVNGIPQFNPDDFREAGTTTIELTYSIEDSDIIDIMILPKFLGCGDSGTTTLQGAYDNSDIGSKQILAGDGEVVVTQTAASGSALRLTSNQSITPVLVVDQSGNGGAVRFKSISTSNPTLLVQADTTTRNSILDTIITERTTSHINGGLTGIGSSVLTRLENTGTSLFSASKIITGTESATDAAENTYLSIELSDDGVLGEKLRLNSDGNLGVCVSNPSLFKIQSAGSVGPDSDNTYDLGSISRRWKSGYFGSDGVTVFSSDLYAQNESLTISHDGTDGYIWSGAGSLHISSNSGNIVLTNSPGDNFDSLQLGGTTDEYPAIARVGRDIHIRTANDGDFTSLACKELDAYGEISSSDGIGVWGVTPPSSQPAKINDPSGGGTIDTEARTAINSIINALEGAGIISSS